MYERFICRDLTMYGYWGAGDTAQIAYKNYVKAGGKKKNDPTTYRFTAELPFAPSDRSAKPDEADCWVGQDGSMSWVRCTRENLRGVIPCQ